MYLAAHAAVRTADPDDAARLLQAYRTATSHAALLDHRREPVMPTRDELTEMLMGKEASKGQFFAIEDARGAIQGFCGLRGLNLEALFGEIILLLLDEGQMAAPLGLEVMDFLKERAFRRLRLQKILATCLDEETELRNLLLSSGFISGGVQRQVLYAGGRWHDLETLVCFRPEGD